MTRRCRPTSRRTQRSAPNKGHRQQGQALAEMLVAGLALCALWVAIAWLGRLQDMALQAVHAARHIAFVATRQPDPQAEWTPMARDAYFDGHHHRWADRRGHDLVSTQALAVSAKVARRAPAPDVAQPASTHAQGKVLRHDWQILDAGVVHSDVTLSFQKGQRPSVGRAWADTLREWEATAYPAIRRSAYILAGAGHADDDAQVRQRVADADLPWAQAARVSYSLSRHVSRTMHAVDGAWHRDGPQGEWLSRWQSWVPGWHTLSQGETP